MIKNACLYLLRVAMFPFDVVESRNVSVRRFSENAIAPEVLAAYRARQEAEAGRREARLAELRSKIQG